MISSPISCLVVLGRSVDTLVLGMIAAVLFLCDLVARISSLSLKVPKPFRIWNVSFKSENSANMQEHLPVWLCRKSTGQQKYWHIWNLQSGVESQPCASLWLSILFLSKQIKSHIVRRSVLEGQFCNPFHRICSSHKPWHFPSSQRHCCYLSPDIPALQKCRPRNISAVMGPWSRLQIISIFLSTSMDFGFPYEPRCEVLSF